MSSFLAASNSESSNEWKRFGKMGKKKKDKHNPLMALLPGAKIDNEKGKISINVGISSETVILNVGGIKFETYRSTLLKQPDSMFADGAFLKKHYRPETGDHFFDRDPDMFKAILSYLRTGELHMPSYVCGPAAKVELEFWGIPDNIIERCCYSHYNEFNSTLKALNRLERDRHGSFDGPETSEKRRLTKWEKFRKQASSILNHPEDSKMAKIYGIISLCVVALSIFSFLADTHPTFRSIQTVLEVKSTFNVTLNTTVRSTEKRIVEVSHPALDIIDISCLVFFTVEYILRIVFIHSRFRYVRSTMGLIDLFALIPDYVQLLMLAFNPSLASSSSTKIFTILKISRILRIFRLVRHVPGLWILVYTLKASLRELLLMVAFLCVGMLIFSSLIYYADDRTIFTSIPHSFWWALITMTTVGYGDMYPVTEWGYVIGSLTAMSGLLMIGFSVPILVNNFIMYYRHVQFALEEERIKRQTLVQDIPKTSGWQEDKENMRNNNSYL